MWSCEELASFPEAGVEVAVDFTSASFAPEHVAWAIEHGTHIVVGTTGFEIDEEWGDAPSGVFVAPNFAIGAVLMALREGSAKHLPSPSRSSSCITKGRPTRRRGRQPRRPTPSRLPASRPGRARTPSPCPASAAASGRASGSIRSGCPASSPTRK